jgi:transposase
MLEQKKDGRREPVIVDIDQIVPKDHLVRKIERVMDYEWLYKRLAPYYCPDNGRPGADPVVLIKMVLLQHLFGISSLRQTWREIEVNTAYRWFLGYNLLDSIPHFATVSYAFCKRFPTELSEEIFSHILNKAINNRMVDPSVVFIDGTQIKASANKKKSQKEQVARTAKAYDEQLRQEVNADRESHGKKPFEDDDDDGSDGSGTVEKTVSTTDPDCGIFRKGEHKVEFAYEAHTACDKHGFVLDVEVTAGNVHDSLAFDPVYDRIRNQFDIKVIAADSAYKTPWITKRIIDDGKIPSMPYTRSPGIKAGFYRPWEYRYDLVTDSYVCPMGQTLKYSTTDRNGKRIFRSQSKICKNCTGRCCCTANAKCQKSVERHIWQEYIELTDQIRKTDLGKETYAMRSQTIERVFADAKEKHSMRYTHYRGLPKVTQWVRLKYAAMNLKKLAIWGWKGSLSRCIFRYFQIFTLRSRFWPNPKPASLTV